MNNMMWLVNIALFVDNPWIIVTCLTPLIILICKGYLSFYELLYDLMLTS